MPPFFGVLTTGGGAQAVCAGAAGAGALGLGKSFFISSRL